MRHVRNLITALLVFAVAFVLLALMSGCTARPSHIERTPNGDGKTVSVCTIYDDTQLPRAECHIEEASQ